MGFGRLGQFRFYYPKIEELCAGDLHGRLMFVPCNALEVIKVEHGERWYEDPASGARVVNNRMFAGYYASTEYPEVMQEY
ncbi:fukutin [Aphelenchoides avenae]|nr:fukutin [Aphelenchus avenae]